MITKNIQSDRFAMKKLKVEILPEESPNRAHLADRSFFQRFAGERPPVCGQGVFNVEEVLAGSATET